MRLIDADAFDTILENGEIEAKKQRKYVLASALNTVRGNLAKQSSVSSSNCSEIPNNWIPCSERLPELDDEVLVTDDRGELRHCIFCTWGETWCGFVTYEEGMRIEPVAWMPLPEPYQPDGFTKWAKSVADSYRNDKEKSE